MARPSVETQSEAYDSSNSQTGSSRDFVIYPKLPKRISEYLRKDSVRDRRQSMPGTIAPDGPDDADTPWDIKTSIS